MKSGIRRLIDDHGRQINYLRVSVTDRCNLRCIYCKPHEGLPKLRHEDILTYEEILRLAEISVALGVSKIRVTGGEPFVRKGFPRFLSRLTGLDGLREVSLTTNGIFLKDYLKDVKASGIKRINVSLDSLRKERYERITGFDGVERVLEGIHAAREIGLYPIKINMVVIEGVNVDEVIDFARLSLEFPYHIRFIEYMPMGSNGIGSKLRHVPNALIKAKLKELGEFLPVPRTPYDGPAERFKFEGAPGEVGFISPLTHHFCQLCNRLRLTPSGQLRPCLLADREEDLKGPMRRGASDDALAHIFLKTARNKPHMHFLASGHCLPIKGRMSSIGG